MRKFNATRCVVALVSKPMKHVVPLLILAPLALAVSSAFAVRSQAQTLEVHESGTGDRIVTHDYYYREHYQTRKVRVTVRDMSRSSPDGEVRIYFIGRKQPELNLYIYNHVVLPIHFGGEMEVNREIDAPTLVLKESYYRSPVYAHYSGGAAVEGWIAEGRLGSRVFGTAASNQKLLAIVKSDELQKLIAAAGIREPQPKPESLPPAAIQAPSKAPSLPAALSTPAPPKAPPPPAEVATLIVPTDITIPYGKTTLPRGTKLKVVSRDSNTVTAVYLDQTITVPVASTVLNRQAVLKLEEGAKSSPAAPRPAEPMSISSAKALALEAPRPEYPGEARSKRLMGSGVVVITVDPASGAVVDARMAQSIGSPILDNSALSAFRRWRFQPGTISKLKIPITFSMSGASY